MCSLVFQYKDWFKTEWVVNSNWFNWSEFKRGGGTNWFWFLLAIVPTPVCQGQHGSVSMPGCQWWQPERILVLVLVLFWFFSSFGFGFGFCFGFQLFWFWFWFWFWFSQIFSGFFRFFGFGYWFYCHHCGESIEKPNFRKQKPKPKFCLVLVVVLVFGF